MDQYTNQKAKLGHEMRNKEVVSYRVNGIKHLSQTSGEKNNTNIRSWLHAHWHGREQLESPEMRALGACEVHILTQFSFLQEKLEIFIGLGSLAVLAWVGPLNKFKVIVARDSPVACLPRFSRPMLD